MSDFMQNFWVSCANFNSKYYLKIALWDMKQIVDAEEKAVGPCGDSFVLRSFTGFGKPKSSTG